MRNGAVVAGLALAGLLGGAVGALLREPPPPATNPGPSPASTASRSGGADAALLVRLQERVAALEGSLAEAGTETARLRARLDERAAAAASVEERLAAAEQRAAEGNRERSGFIPFGGESGGPAVATDVALSERTVELTRSVERLRGMAELARLTREERWEKARLDLGLTPHQEETLKEAIDTWRKDLRGAMEDKEITNRDNDQVVRVRLPDPEKMKEARRSYDDRVTGLLNEEQAKKWKESGYGSSLGAPSEGSTVSTAVIIETK